MINKLFESQYTKQVENKEKNIKSILSLKVINSTVKILNEKNTDNILEEAEELAKRAIAYALIKYKKEDLLSFFNSRKLWMEPYEDLTNVEFEIILNAQLFLEDFTFAINRNENFKMYHLLKIIGGIKTLKGLS